MPASARVSKYCLRRMDRLSHEAGRLYDIDYQLHGNMQVRRDALYESAATSGKFAQAEKG